MLIGVQRCPRPWQVVPTIADRLFSSACQRSAALPSSDRASMAFICCCSSVTSTRNGTDVITRQRIADRQVRGKDASQLGTKLVRNVEWLLGHFVRRMSEAKRFLHALGVSLGDKKDLVGML